MNRTPRAVIVGTGFIGPVHAEGLKRAGVDVVSMIGSTPEKSRTASALLGLASVHDTLDAALRDPSVDAIHLTTPNALHFEQARAVLRAGKHCLCEKPLAMNPRESAELVRLSADSGLAAGVAYNIRFYPLCHEAAARVRSGSIGSVVHVTGSYVQDWLLRPTDFNWRVLAEDGGELRAVADIGTHWLDLIQFVCGKKIVEVCADLRTVHPQRYRPTGGVETFSQRQPNESELEAIAITTEDCGAVLLRFEDGANGCMWVSQVTAGRKNCLRFELAGTHQAMHWDSEQPNQLWIGHRDRPNESLIRDPSLLDPTAAVISQYPGGHNEGFPDTFKQLFRQFYSYIERGDFGAPAPFPTFLDGHREVLLCEAILTSHRRRGWAQVADVERA